MAAMTAAELEECVQIFFGCPAEEVLEVWQTIDSDGDGDDAAYELVGTTDPDANTCTLQLVGGEGQVLGEKTLQFYDESLGATGTNEWTFVDHQGNETVIDVIESQFEFTLNPDGSIDILHTNGEGVEVGGTIPPMNSDEMTVDTDADGNVTVSHTDVNGNTQSFVIPAPTPDTDATVVDNGDGSATITDDDGDSCVVSTEQIRFRDADPIQGIVAKDRTNLKDGTTVTEFLCVRQRIWKQASGGVAGFDAGDGAGAERIYGAVNFVFSGCPGTPINVDGYAQSRSKLNGNPVTESMNVQYFMRLDGGAWVGMSGITDHRGDTAGNGSNGSAETNTEFTQSIVVPTVGAHTLEWMVRLVSDEGEPGSGVDFNQARILLSFHDIRCLPAI